MSSYSTLDSSESEDNSDHASMASQATTGPRHKKPQAPQDIIDEFWSKFTSKTPGRARRLTLSATTVIPSNQYADRVVRKNAKAAASSITTSASYDDAAAMCRAKVDKIVKECRRINKKYRDPYFDLESDLKLNRRDCLESLSNQKSKGKEDDAPGQTLQPRSAKRVVDIFDKPQFFVDGPSANDVRQGRDGDCWLMAALCLLSNKPGLIEKLCVAHDQAVGVYGFVFHRDGEWISEIVDDFLYLTKPDYDEGYLDRVLFDDIERVNPDEAYRRIYQSNSGSLYFAQCEHPQETWLPLLEKCYAKAHGDYAAIEGGFGGEGIEDLTGGVTSEVWTTDILDKDHFWQELLKVNQEFLFGCSTGVWGVNWGERKGIMELHAYSIQRAVEIDGKRLLRLKNPWGKGEWKGAWSDGSKEWTPEWMEKLGHRFGDDGDFWIAYEDLMRKYQAFERTRLFDKDWRVSQTWTTLTIPWTLDYHDTYFTVSIAKPGPVVIVLAQLDDRYFRGLEGQYYFELAFRLHKAGHEDYLVRSQAPYRMRRSVNVELELEAGEYDVRVKVDAIRYEDVLPIQDVIRQNAKRRREKLTRIGLAYDLAHSKGKVVETDKEKAAREAHEQKTKEKEREKLKQKILSNREEVYYLKVKQLQRDRKKLKKRERKAKEAAEKAASTSSKRNEGSNHDEGLQTNEASATEPCKEQPEAAPATDNKTVDSQDDVGGQAASAGTTATLQPATDEARVDEKDSKAASNVSVRFHEDPIVQDAAGKAPQQEGSARPEARPSSNIIADSDAEGEGSDIDSLSDLSDRELDLQVDAYQREASRCVGPSETSFNQGQETSVELDEFEKDPWNAVAVVGLRVYYKYTDETKETEAIKLDVVRPDLYADDEDDSDDSKTEKSKGLDVDDSAKDATLKGGVAERKKSIMGDGQRRV
ncbi:hypothetical protein S7711_04775 [Stachybotrys chartarum IBT 7711]|uniref:Calpain catalytic domain-containing protein n=1 Tax=Stachybotrys chartarum (strain CBS 109288 / IBT 7711) TaxID=1280523 RepID=A0A084ASG5_STACB|nr:hypothetical protein S7711_04775 [Stachybotrys chartarum IBT 7711]